MLKASFKSAAISYCDIVEDVDFECPNGNAGTKADVRSLCTDLETSNYEDALTSSELDAVSNCIDTSGTNSILQEDTPTPTATATIAPTSTPAITGIQLATTYLTYANSNYDTAISTAENAQFNVTMAQAALDAAVAAQNQVEDGASKDDINAAKDGVTAAQAAYDAANAALQELIDGATNETISDLSAAVDKAQADLTAAEAARDKAISGATSTELSMQQEQVHAAELQVQQANIALDYATLVSPFDGVVSALPLKIGQVVNAALPAVTILTPGTLIFQLNVGETELASHQGRSAGSRHDSTPCPAGRIELRSSRSASRRRRTRACSSTRSSARYSTTRTYAGQSNPAPGMNGSAKCHTELHENVVAIPSAVVRARGGQQVVEVIGDDGKIEIRPVTTGLTDGANIEITQGLVVGDTIAVRASAAAKTAAQTPLPGGIQ